MNLCPEDEFDFYWMHLMFQVCSKEKIELMVRCVSQAYNLELEPL